jgi:WD40 repeat protein
VPVRTGTRLLEFTPGLKRNLSGLLPMAFSPDGDRIAIGIGEATGGIVIHDARDGKKLLAWDAPRTERLEFNADGRLLLTSSGGQIHLWDANEGKLAWTYPQQGEYAVHGVFSPDGQQVVTTESKDNFRLVNARDGTLIRALPRSRHAVSALAMHPDGTVTAVGERGTALRIDLRNDRVLADFRASDRRIDQVALTPDGRRIVTAVSLPDGRQDIRLWHASTGAPVQTLLGGSGSLGQISVHPLTGELLVGGPNARAWSLTGSSEKWTLQGYLETRTAFVGSDDVIFAPGGLVKLQSGSSTVMWKAPGYARQATVSADGHLAVFGPVKSVQPIILLRNPGPAAEQIGSFVPKLTTQLLRLSPTGDRLALKEGGGGEVLRVLDVATGKEPVKLERKDVHRFWDLGWLDDRRLLGLVTAKKERGNPGAEEWIVLWDVTTGKILQTATNRSPMDVLALAPDGRRFAEAGADKRVRLRDAATLAVQQEFRAHDGPITALAWHPTKPIVATASADLSVKIWNLETGRRLEELRGPVAAPNALSFSPSGKRLACSSAEGVTRVWEPKSLDDRPVTQQEIGGWEDLLAPLTPTTVTQTGNGWRVDGGVLYSPGKRYAILPLPADLNGTSYQVRVKVRQLAPKGVFHIVLPVGDRMTGFDLDGRPQNGIYTGLVQVNGKLGKDLPGVIEGKQVKDSEQHDLEVTVRLVGPSAVITTTLDDQRLYEWAGPVSSLSQHPSWNSPPGTLALGTATADWVVYEVKVKRLDAK